MGRYELITELCRLGATTTIQNRKAAALVVMMYEIINQKLNALNQENKSLVDDPSLASKKSLLTIHSPDLPDELKRLISSWEVTFI